MSTEQMGTDQMSTDTTAEELAAQLDAAARAFPELAAATPADRAGMLRAVAERLTESAAELVAVAVEETALTPTRLHGEVQRTTGQLELFARVIEEGAYLDAVIDLAEPNLPVPRPDLRRVNVAVGPVVVFAASNFPFAFSVAGTDTASALAAGCPVVLKAHPGHPRLSRLTGRLVDQALTELGAPAGSFSLIEGVDAGRAAVQARQVRAGAFTGSIPGGRALFDLAVARPDPIPFYAEMGSLNPVVVTAAAARDRGPQIAADFVASFTLGAGQFCTKPGLLFVPTGSSLVPAIIEAVQSCTAQPMLNVGIATGYQRGVDSLDEGAQLLASGTGATQSSGLPRVFGVSATQLLQDQERLLVERFGPCSLVVEYDGERDLRAALLALEGNLTATVHLADEDLPVLGPLLAILRERAGRLICNGWPTGVAVTAAMHHGGPYPATTLSAHTSVGTGAIARFLRPVAYQSTPDQLLPPALRNRNELGIVRRVNGKATTADVIAGIV